MLRRSSEPLGPGRSLGSLIEDLLGQLGHFIDQKLNLLRLELEHDLGLLVRYVVILVIGGAIAALGLVLVAVALALWVAGLLGSGPAGFGLTGIAFLGLGAIVVAVRGRRGIDPSRRHALQRTTGELRKDAQWLSSGR
jgi:uncharacterized membrane protein YqjE